MRLTIKQEKSIEIGTAELRCNQITSEVKRIQSYAEQLSHTIHAKNEQGTYETNTSSIYYIESTDKRTFLYEKDAVLETPLRLYQLEEQLNPKYFIRISKGCIVNISYVTSIHLLLNRNLELRLDNDEKLIVSRRYVKAFQTLLEMR